MPPRRPIPRPQISRPRGSDPTVSIAAASSARTVFNTQLPEQTLVQKEEVKEQKPNDDLKKLIETLKSKMAPSTQIKKQVPPQPTAKNTWNRSLPTSKEKTWVAKPAYTILSRVSNHEKVPLRETKPNEMTISSLPHSFLYRPGADGIKIDKLSIKAGKQISWG